MSATRRLATGQLRPPKFFFSKTCWVVRYNNKLQSFFPENSTTTSYSHSPPTFSAVCDYDHFTPSVCHGGTPYSSMPGFLLRSCTLFQIWYWSWSVPKSQCWRASFETCYFWQGWHAYFFSRHVGTVVWTNCIQVSSYQCVYFLWDMSLSFSHADHKQGLYK